MILSSIDVVDLVRVSPRRNSSPRPGCCRAVLRIAEAFGLRKYYVTYSAAGINMFAPVLSGQVLWVSDFGTEAAWLWTAATRYIRFQGRTKDAVFHVHSAGRIRFLPSEQGVGWHVRRYDDGSYAAWL